MPGRPGLVARGRGTFGLGALLGLRLPRRDALAVGGAQARGRDRVHARQFGVLPESGSDFVTAPELSPLFGRALAEELNKAWGQAVIVENRPGAGSTIAARYAAAPSTPRPAHLTR